MLKSFLRTSGLLIMKYRTNNSFKISYFIESRIHVAIWRDHMFLFMKLSLEISWKGSLCVGNEVNL